MRDKELNDRYTREQSEQAWISVMHGQAPPTPNISSLEIETRTGMIPLSPMVDSSSSPLVAARAAAASMSSWQSESSYQSVPAPAWSAASSRLAGIRSVAGGIVKLDKQPLPALPFERPRAATDNMRFPFASTMAKPPMIPRATAEPATPAPAHTLLELLPKRKHDEEDQARHLAHDEAARAANGAKRACLPKKCDFPMCKNSSRSRGFCYSHGGGRRCRVEGCTNGAVSRDLCKRHGGGRRCRIPGCKSSSESGGLCYSHGGGRRCSLSWCNARAKKGGYCAVHLEHKDATPPPETTDSSSSSSPSTEPTSPSPAAVVASSQVVETLLALSKSPKDTETEAEAQSSPTSPSRPSTNANPYALTSILN